MSAHDAEGRFRAAIDRFDAANAADPNREPDAAGVEQPRELLYARRMSEMLERFAPEASEAVRLAVRCQHIRRWEIPRDSYPRTPEGYKAWRTRLMDFHADAAAAILREAGYDEEPIARVRSLLRKERLKRDPETQLLEDVIGLVFLEHYLAGFVSRAPRIRRSEVRGHPPQDLAEDVAARPRSGADGRANPGGTQAGRRAGGRSTAVALR